VVADFGPTGRRAVCAVVFQQNRSQAGIVFCVMLDPMSGIERSGWMIADNSLAFRVS